jgi:beta-phosphoglucomutase-like phosphatase (HAD superfamily)
VKTNKPVLIVDFDDTLREFNEPLRLWTNKHCATNIASIKEIHNFNLDSVWKCGIEEMRERLARFYESEEFMRAQYFSGAQETIARLSEKFTIIIATARPSSLAHTTRTQLAPIMNFIESVYFKEDFPKGGKGILARSLGAVLAIDDANHNVHQYVQAGIKVVQFNYNNSFGWNELSSAPDDVLRSASWEENYEHCMSVLGIGK